MSDLAQLANELRDAVNADIYTDAEECEASVAAATAAIQVAAERLERAVAYNAEIDRLGLTANVFDYAAIIKILGGDTVDLPTDKDR